VLLESEIHRTIPDAIAAFGPSRNILWATGPSKTADVEGILIEGVHGPGEQVAFFI
jgi:L-lactate dehydrogenase complex protein LldG